MSFLAPNRRRWIILVLIFTALVLNYVDRQIVSILKPTLKAEFGIDDEGYARLLNVFTICYATMYPVAGWLVDRFPVRRVMLVGIISWSLACIGAGLTRSFAGLAGFRGMLGLAEPTAFPAQLRVITMWFPKSLRATANSICVAGGTLGAIIAPSVVAALALKFNWHAAFLVPGALGLIIAVLWWMIYRDPPKEILEQSLADSEMPPTAAFTWGQLWRTRSLWGILLIRFVSDPVWYFCLFWLPGYLQERSGLTLKEIGIVGWIPFLAADLGGIGSAMWSDAMVRRGKAPLQARKIMLSAMACLAPVIALTPHFPNVSVTLAIFGVVGAVCLSWLFSLSVVLAETFPRNNIASVLGIAGGFGAVGGMIFNLFVGKMMVKFGPTPIFTVMAFLHPVAVLFLWTMIRPERPASTQPFLEKTRVEA